MATSRRNRPDRHACVLVALIALIGATPLEDCAAQAEHVDEVVRRLGSSDKTRQSEAVERLSAIGRDALPALAAALRHPDRRVNAGAAKALSRIGRDAVPALVEALRDPDVNVRRWAAYALRFMKSGSEVAVPALVVALHDPEDWVRLDAAKALASIGPRAELAVQELVGSLRDKNEHVRVEAAIALGCIGAGAVPALIRALHAEDQLVSEGAATALSELGPAGAPAASMLADCLQDPSEFIRLSAVHGLGAIVRQPADSVLIDRALRALLDAALGDRSSTVSAEAVGYVQEYGSMSRRKGDIVLWVLPYAFRQEIALLTLLVASWLTAMRRGASRFTAPASRAVHLIVTTLVLMALVDGPLLFAVTRPWVADFLPAPLLTIVPFSIAATATAGLCCVLVSVWCVGSVLLRKSASTRQPRMQSDPEPDA